MPASVPICSLRQDRRVRVPCFSSSHSPDPHGVSPVLSTSRCMEPEPGRGDAAASVSALRLRVEWSGTARSRPSTARTEPISPSIWRSARRSTARSVSTVAIARAEVRGCPPRVVLGSAFQAATAASVNQTAGLPRWRRAASQAAEFVTLCRRLGMWWRHAARALNGRAPRDPGDSSDRLACSIPARPPRDPCTEALSNIITNGDIVFGGPATASDTGGEVVLHGNSSDTITLYAGASTVFGGAGATSFVAATGAGVNASLIGFTAADHLTLAGATAVAISAAVAGATQGSCDTTLSLAYGIRPTLFGVTALDTSQVSAGWRRPDHADPATLASRAALQHKTPPTLRQSRHSPARPTLT